MKRAQTFSINMAANTTEQVQTPTFNDKSFVQSFKEVFVGITTKGVLLTVYYSGRKVVSFDCSMFGIAPARGHFEVSVPAQQQLTFSLTDSTGAGNADVPVTFIYDIPNGADGTQP